MTVLCGGNPSGAKPGFAQLLFVGPASVAALLNNIPVSWAVLFAAYIGSITYNLSTFCTTDPPAVPVITAADAIAVLTPLGDPVAHDQAIIKFQDFVGAFAWYQFCQCLTVATPAPPAAPAAPIGLPALQPGVGAPPLSACWDKHGVSQVLVGFTNDITGTLTPGGLTFITPLPVSVTFSGQVLNDVAGASTADMHVIWKGSSGTTIKNDHSGNVAPGGFFSVTSTPPANAAFIELSINWIAGAGQNTVVTEFTIICSGSGVAGFSAPCCPPDPILQAQVSLILDTVNLLQRQLLPFAYVTSTVHAGLSGSGTLAVADLIGIILDVTTNPGYTGIEAAQPDILFDIGWVSVLTPDGLIDQRRISAAHTVWQPRLMSEATVVGYFLNPGVIATITELVREF